MGAPTLLHVRGHGQMDGHSSQADAASLAEHHAVRARIDHGHAGDDDNAHAMARDKPDRQGTPQAATLDTPDKPAVQE